MNHQHRYNRNRYNRQVHCQFHSPDPAPGDRRPLGQPRLLALLAAGLLAMLLSGCGLFGRPSEAASEPYLIRTPYPTFTPTTALQPETAAPTASLASDPGQAQAPTPPPPQVRAVVNTALVNARTGPGTDFAVVEMVEQGQELEVVGKNPAGTWWQICCVDGQTAWIIGEYVDIAGPADAVPVTSGPNAVAPQAQAAPQPPIAVVNTPLVNVRSGPGTQFQVITMVERGQEFDIVGKNPAGTWWQICCVEGQTAWIIGEYVDTDGPVDGVPVTSGPRAAAPLPASTEAAPPPVTPTSSQPSAASTYTFDLVAQEQFPESEMVRVYLYVYAENNSALAGYSLQVLKDGAALPVEEKSFGGQPGFTWPFQDARQRFQNMKVEFPGVAPAGTWQVQLVDGQGAAVGPAATFVLSTDDPRQELYVRYQRR